MFDTACLLEMDSLRQSGTPFCLVTIVDGRGSIPQIIGARAIFTRDGLRHGTVGGGRIEERCRERAHELLNGSLVRNSFERLNLNRDVGMTCAGEVAIYMEVYRPELEWNVVVFGAGHVSQKLCRFLVELDCQVTCIDTRPEWLSRLPDHERLEIREVAQYADGIEHIRPRSTVIIMTMGHATDMPILTGIAKRDLEIPYLGVIGSDSKAAIMRRALREAGVADEFIAGITCPMGDKIGNNTPPEIAVGVLAQLVRLRESAFAEDIRTAKRQKKLEAS